MDEHTRLALITTIGDRLTAHTHTLAVAESCTGGLCAATLTTLPGASAWFIGGYIVYSNLLKQRLLGVREHTLTSCGAVSEEVAYEMVVGVCQYTKADYAAAITGVAGPGGGTFEKPVGLVWCAVAEQAGKVIHCWRIRADGDRQSIRQAAVDTVLTRLHTLCTKER